MLSVKYVNIVIETISIALPVCIKAVPAKTNTKSGYAIAAANEAVSYTHLTLPTILLV